ncbi:hypothetical protein [Microbacterium sp. SS28]|uniref:hypothetical protein n=1 Tax=Microbacterium sp. SS28 TaxID=2919948 RepID=UPI001FAAD6CE|nr:hypothetical protein [Microbacterium sp. SS28]
MPTEDAKQPHARRPDTATTGHRTHRYLRLSLGVLVIAILVSVGLESLQLGAVLPSISHYFYSAAQPVFVGALVAASLALAALSGRGLETTLLDVAAVFAPLIAIVPTGIYGRSLQRELGVACPPRTMCVPDQYLDQVRNGVATYLIVLVLVVAIGLLLRRRKRISGRGIYVVAVVGAITLVALGALAFVPILNDGFPSNRLFPVGIHYTVTIAFFGAFAAVPIINAFRVTTDAESKPKLWQKLLYLAIALALIADLIVLVFFAASLEPAPVVFICEAIALALFAAFWFVQTAQRWDERDQEYVLPTPPLAWSEVR